MVKSVKLGVSDIFRRTGGLPSKAGGFARGCPPNSPLCFPTNFGRTRQVDIIDCGFILW